MVLVTSQGASVPAEKPEDKGQQFQESGERQKRSGELVGYIGNKLAPKISAFASASAGLSSLSSASKHEYGPPTEEAKSFDFWAFKKALLSTLLQAVKAIKGGIIAVKGQIIKAKGHLLSTKGRIISAKGEAISNFGKQLANTALKLDAPKTSSAPTHPTAPSAGYSFGPTSAAVYGSTGPSFVSGTGFGGLSPHISTSYGAPTAPSGHYGATFKLPGRRPSGNHGAPTAKSSSSLSRGTHAGLLVIKPIPSSATSSGAARSSAYGSSSLHDFFGAPSHAFATFVAAPASHEPSAASRRSDYSSYAQPQNDYSESKLEKRTNPPWKRHFLNLDSIPFDRTRCSMMPTGEYLMSLYFLSDKPASGSYDTDCHVVRAESISVSETYRCSVWHCFTVNLSRSPISNPTLPKWTNVLLRKMLLRAQAEHISILIINFYTNNADNIYPISKTQILTNRSNYSRASIIRTSVIRPTAGNFNLAIRVFLRSMRFRQQYTSTTTLMLVGKTNIQALSHQVPLPVARPTKQEKRH
ncbi:hypothetical protein Cfor_11651 [Coptotermes formosanus]|uniref:Uncharacterized protein n=1 Tax=Coptotermes formosanus TaxID=36987 RepID=A0A6L2PME3_COPFO|nr:hypothetical protein Cfor_11651 [Coptotermes formosanus]